MDLLVIVIFAASVLAFSTPAPTPSPGPSASADPCASQRHTNLFSTVNRPSIGYSPCAVQRGEAVLEGGFQVDRGDTVQWQYGQAFWRFGVAHNVEADIIGPNYLQQRAPSIASGLADSGVGMKWEFARSTQSTAGIDVLYTVPSGDAAFTSGKPTQTVNVDYSTSFSKFGFSSTVGAMHGNGYGTLLPSVLVSNQFNDRAQWYAEAFWQTHASAQGGALFGQDGGLQYLVTPAVMLDAELGHSVAPGNRVHYIGFGFSARF